MKAKSTKSASSPLESCGIAFKECLCAFTRNRGSFISAHVLFEFIKRVEEKRKNTRLAEHFYLFFTTSTNVRFYLSYDIKIRGIWD